MDLGLRGRRALITGGSKGIGLAVAEQLASEGCDVMLVSRTQADLEAARKKLEARHNVAVRVAAYDLSQTASIAPLVAEAGELDILVNNAGAIPAGRLNEIDNERWRAAWDLKVFGYVNLTRAVYDGMKARGKGVIVNIIGAAGEKMNAAYIAGSTGNAGLMAFSKALGGASPADGIRVVAINPGLTATDRLVTLKRKEAEDTLGDPDRWQELMTGLPFGRPGKPEEIAAMAAFLASDLSGYTTGTVITIDGGTSNRS